MAVKIDDRWRTQRYDTEGEEITAIRVQPVTEVEDLVHVKLTH